MLRVPDGIFISSVMLDGHGDEKQDFPRVEPTFCLSQGGLRRAEKVRDTENLFKSAS